MRPLLILPIVLLSLLSTPSYSVNLLCGSVGIGCETIDSSDLVEKEGVQFKKFSNTPFTGHVVGMGKGFLKSGNYHDEWEHYYPSGEISSLTNFNNGTLHGSIIHWRRDGQVIKKGNYVDGVKDGYWEINSFRLFGNKLKHTHKGYYKNGEREGHWVGYHSDGQLESQGNYKNGLKEGYWEMYRPDGTINGNDTGTYKNGVKVSD